MDKGTYWLLTDSRGQTVAGASVWCRWGRGVTHTVWPAAIAGYCTESVHLPYLLDPLYERYGAGARIWLSEIGEAQHVDNARASSHTWTTLVERERPEWVGGAAEMRVRLRFGLLASAAALSNAEFRAHLGSMSLADLPKAAMILARLHAETRRRGSEPRAVCMAAMAVHAAASYSAGRRDLIDLALRHYPLYAWYAAMAAACACVNLTALADEAVKRETRTAGPVRRPVLETVSSS